MCSRGTSSTVQGKSLQLRARHTLGWSTCSRSCCHYAAVTSTRNSRQVALRTTLGLLMQSGSSARPYDRTDHHVMTERTKQQQDLDKTHETNLRCICVRLKMKVNTFIQAKCPRPNAKTPQSQESNFQKYRVLGRFYHCKQKHSGQNRHIIPIVERVRTALDLENISV